MASEAEALVKTFKARNFLGGFGHHAKKRPAKGMTPRQANSEGLGIGRSGYDTTRIGRVSKPKNSNGLSVGIIH
jgi:hypothetical protein